MRVPLHSESGQAAVLAMLCAFAMVVFVAMAANMGTLTSDRTRFQSTIDVTAYAGGFEQARILNKLTQINQQIVYQVNVLRTRLNSQEWQQPPCSCIDYSPRADNLINSYQAVFDNLADRFNAMNQLGQTTSKAAARHTANRNLLGDAAANPYHLGFFQGMEDSPTSWDVVMPASQVQDTQFSYLYTKSCRCCDTCCPYPGYIREPLTLTTWFYKENPETMVFFPAKMRGTPLKRFFDIPGSNGYFGASANGGTDQIASYAVSKPYSGKIGTPDPGNDGWGPTMQPGIYDSGFYNTHFRDDYRARIAGIQEDMGSSQSTGQKVTVAELIDEDTWAPQYRGKGELFLH